MNTIHVLLHARELISKPERWCKIYFAVTQEGKAVSYRSDEAVAYCAVGALWKAVHKLNADCDTLLRAYNRLREATIELSEHRWPEPYNDDPNTTHEDILRVYDHAITLAEEWEECFL